jgi:hypothetical protein
MTNKAYRVYISFSRIIIESIYIKFNENANNEIEKGIDIIGVELLQVDNDDETEQRQIEINELSAHSPTAT